MAALEPRRALSVVTWGAAGQVEASKEMLAGLTHLVDDPIDQLKAKAAYLVEAYGVQNARIMAASWAGALGGIAAAGGDISRSRATSITCPALLITGEDDPFCPPSLVRDMADAISRGEYREAPGAGHDVHLSHSAWLRAAVVDWLSDH
jgi:valacyclovir hydrolase